MLVSFFKPDAGSGDPAGDSYNTRGRRKFNSMVNNLRVLRDFATGSATNLADTGDSVGKGLTDNATAFPTPPVKPADLATLTTGLRTAMAVAASGGPQATAAKDKAFAALADALRKDAHYVEIQANHDLETALSSGFNVVSTNRAPAPLDAPVIVDIENLASTQILLRLNPMANVRSFQVQTSTDGKTWTEAGIYTQSRRIVLMGLTPGITYYARVRAIGGSTGRSDWSVPASLMAT